jgi:type I restriction enzyme S subunit
LKENDFQETRFGKIPKDWQTSTLVKSVGNNDNVVAGPFGSNLKVSDYRDNGVPILRLQNIENCQFVNKDIKYVSEKKAAELKYHSFLKGDIVLAKLGQPIGKTCIVPSFLENGIVVADVVRIKIDNSSALDKNYAMYILNSSYVSGQLNREIIGTTRPRVNLSQVRNLLIPFPRLPEQRDIARVLGVVGSAIELADKVIAKTERLKKGLMQQLLTRGIGHTEYKDTPIGTIPKTWQIAKLEEVSKEVIIGNVNPATPFYTTAENGVPYFRSQNVRENNLLPTNIYVKKEFNQIHPKSILKENDVLTIQTGFIGTSCLVPKTDEGSNCHSLLITRTNPQLLNPQFLCHFLNSDAGKKIIMKHNAGWGRDHLLLEYFRKADIPIPPLAEQDRIVNILSTIYQKAALERNEKLRLERIKVGLMDLLLTGKVRIKVD